MDEFLSGHTAFSRDHDIMIIQLSVPNYAEKPPADEKRLLIALRKLIYSNYNGANIVITSPESHNNLIYFDSLDELDKTILSDSVKNYILHADYFFRHGLILEVFLGFYKESAFSFPVNKVFVVDVEFLEKNPNVINRPALICEHWKNDGDTLDLMLEGIAMRLGPTSVPEFSLAREHGQGSLIYQIFSSRGNDDPIVVILTDTDRECVPEKPTFDVMFEQNYPNIRIKWPCHEIENLVPISVLNIVKRTEIQKIMSVLSISPGDTGPSSAKPPWSLLDLKEGISDSNEAGRLGLNTIRGIPVPGLGNFLKSIVKCDRARKEMVRYFQCDFIDQRYLSVLTAILLIFANRPRPPL